RFSPREFPVADPASVPPRQFLGDRKAKLQTVQALHVSSEHHSLLEVHSVIFANRLRLQVPPHSRNLVDGQENVIQKLKRRPNCISLGFFALKICPKFTFPKVLFGMSKFVRLRTLKTSHRNSRRPGSPILQSLLIAISRLEAPGPKT